MNLPSVKHDIAPTSPAFLIKTKEFEGYLLTVPQEPMETYHTIHAGVYTRTITLKRNQVMTSALIKIPTTIIINGDVTVTMGDNEFGRIKGYRVLTASSDRKQVYVAHKDTDITMIFKTGAMSVEEAEMQFTDEWDRLLSRSNFNRIIITGE